MFTQGPWKGNVRELANFIERAIIVTRGEELEMPTAALCPSSESIVTVSSTSTFRQRNPL
jgi:DNA-binding NtrC family response regulator